MVTVKFAAVPAPTAGASWTAHAQTAAVFLYFGVTARTVLDNCRPSRQSCWWALASLMPGLATAEAEGLAAVVAN